MHPDSAPFQPDDFAWHAYRERHVYKDALPCGDENLRVMILGQKGMTVEADRFQEMHPECSEWRTVTVES
jgi:hypothetical protein